LTAVLALCYNSFGYS